MRPPPRRLLYKRVTYGERVAWETVRALGAIVRVLLRDRVW